MVDFPFIVSLYVSDLPNVTISTVLNVYLVRILPLAFDREHVSWFWGKQIDTNRYKNI